MKGLNTNHRGGWQPWEELMWRWMACGSPRRTRLPWSVNEEILGDRL